LPAAYAEAAAKPLASAAADATGLRDDAWERSQLPRDQGLPCGSGHIVASNSFTLALTSGSTGV
jgi:hypothetical protein